ncbi:MAG: hypothetical protein A2051_10010 [Desulfovibrionales bacterium GWA2_65_9]|nr:MAG: hypothetical protein A2051_10010 [Desulfovibrionales bacterium GWA2_65_9]
MPARPKSPGPTQVCPSGTRPSRPSIIDELGLAKTLPAGPGDFRTLCGSGPDVLFLGLGPEPENLPDLFPALGPGRGKIRYMECPELAAQLGPDWRGRIPAGFAEAAPEDMAGLARSGARLILYTPGQRLFPSFWGPLLARVQLALLASAISPISGPTSGPASGPASGPRQRLAWLPGGEGDLLRIELREALEDLGFSVRCTGDSGMEDYRAWLAAGECPQLFLSVNFSGLDPLGEVGHLLQAAGARVAVWCVDNPLHLLSGLKSRFWTGLPLFVTDEWFVEPLKRLGATDVRHLPLAARARDLNSPPPPPATAWAELAGRLVFVGRSAFPGKDGFFAGCARPGKEWAEAQAMLDQGQRPDFGWWLERLKIERLWPGAEVRRAGFCAEETGRAWRALCLGRALEDLGRVTVFGDAGWQELLPKASDLRGPVDYYTALPDIAASAGANLNLTNPLLPSALTQRHFDTWAWGGLLVSDATPGLSLFPAELTQEITFRAPRELAERFRTLTSSPALAADLKTAWRAELARAHTYGHRVAAVLDGLGLSA